MSSLPTLRSASLRGRRVFVRVDFNVPLQNGRITDDRRIRSALPTIQYLLQAGAAVLLCSHLGRPKEGQRDSAYSLQPVRSRLEELLGQPVGWIEDPFKVTPLSPGQVYLLENIRFFPGETKNDPALAQALATWADVYVGDAFGSLHRAHASVDALPRLMKERYAGFLVEAEWANAQRLLTQIKSPYLVVVGGAKVSDKLPLLRNLLPKLDRLVIGGGMSYTFLYAQGLPIGKSLWEPDQVEAAREILREAERLGKRVLLPRDSVAASEFRRDAEPKVFTHQPGEFPPDFMGLDIGPQTLEAASSFVTGSQTIFWNGPMGVFEWEAFRTGTLRLAEEIAAETKKGAYSLIGGGDTAAAVEMAGVADQMSFISTGGGALLELLAGYELPGIVALLS
ncbi:MAG: phosphoglycerate kinase [Bacteroidia bacterium]|nr:phosphoglycerate kinase [Bacteroidia bacterium]MDW8014906.1 phosphoglycerate kinase [Bacteroidia bacterium]